MKGKRLRIQFRRRRQGKTNYYKRLSLLKSMKLRLVVRKSLRNLTLQIVEYVPTGDKVLVAYNTKSLEKLGWSYSKKNIPAAYLGGIMIGKLAKSKKIIKAILDCGLHSTVKGSVIFAVLKGAIDAGLDIPCGDEIFPDEARLSGKHIADYLAKSKDKNVTQFTQYKKAKLGDITKDFMAIKEKILKGN